MACPNSDCTGNATVVLGGFTFTSTDWLDNGTPVERGATEIPNLNIQRTAKGAIARIAKPGYVKQEITVTTASNSIVYEALWQAHINGSACFDAAVINDPCYVPKAFTDAVLTSMDPPDSTYDDAQGTFTFEAVPVS
ncbi:MAG: hypothetical protein GKR96_04250 [Gammaproteobacteria bacterium]|nr:hypothetical protein [Gammaproteobacteria bacterium]